MPTNPDNPVVASQASESSSHNSASVNSGSSDDSESRKRKIPAQYVVTEVAAVVSGSQEAAQVADAAHYHDAPSISSTRASSPISDISEFTPAVVAVPVTRAIESPIEAFETETEAPITEGERSGSTTPTRARTPAPESVLTSAGCNLGYPSQPSQIGTRNSTPDVDEMMSESYLPNNETLSAALDSFTRNVTLLKNFAHNRVQNDIDLLECKFTLDWINKIVSLVQVLHDSMEVQLESATEAAYPTEDIDVDGEFDRNSDDRSICEGQVYNQFSNPTYPTPENPTPSWGTSNAQMAPVIPDNTPAPILIQAPALVSPHQVRKAF
ncbi:hypothetical protein RSOL_235950, partial [Rhizoctonia solani AG-3 Rhs1AP]